MFTYRVMSAACRVLWIALVLVGFVCRPSYSQVVDALPLDDPNAVVRTVLAAVKAIELPTIGRGTATMRTEGYQPFLDGKDLIVDFVFKDQKSRRDVFESSDGSRGRRWYAEATSDKFHLILTHDNADVSRSGSSDRQVVRDFHPEAFMKFHFKSLAHWVEAFLAPGIGLSVTVDGEGILHMAGGGHVVSSQTGEEYDTTGQLSFDTQKGLRPVLYKTTVKYPGKEMQYEINRLRWAKFGSVWYVSHLERSVRGTNFSSNVEFTVKSFDPNPEVSDEEFTLAGLDVPHGMLVFDSVAGVQYRYGSPPEALEDLEKPLAEANFVEKIRKQQDDVASQPVDANAQQELSDPNHALVVDETHADSPWPRGILTASIVVLIGVVVFLGYRYGIARAKS